MPHILGSEKITVACNPKWSSKSVAEYRVLHSLFRDLMPLFIKKKVFFLYNPINFWDILFPISLANLVVGGGISHQILLERNIIMQLYENIRIDENKLLCIAFHRNDIFYCPACRTTLVATRFRVAVICPIIQVPHCIRVFFYFVWFVFINHIFNFIMNYVPIVTFWIFTYHKIWILSIMFCFIWSYWIIYFLACLEVSWRVVS